MEYVRYTSNIAYKYLLITYGAYLTVLPHKVETLILIQSTYYPFNRRCRIYSGFHFLLAH